MIKIEYDKIIPYPFEVVLSQYFDYEHIAHVHPDTLGEYAVVETNGNEIIYDQIWPGPKKKRSRVRHTFHPPGEMWFEFIYGLHKGTKVHTRLQPCPEGTQVDETYYIPGLPDWGWLRRLVKPSVMKSVNRIWNEDLAVEVCYNGWPGVPDSSGANPYEFTESNRDEWHSLGEREALLDQAPMMKIVEGAEVALFAVDGELRAFEARCPHTGGPLHLGSCDDDRVSCPWHGASFDLRSGAALLGPAPRGLKRFETKIEDGTVLIRV